MLTGFSNRRAYEKDIRSLSEARAQDDLVYIAIDINELKEVNDAHGHETGDRLIVGAADCIRQCFGDRGRMYRIGGDEFAVLFSANRDELDGRFGAYEKSMADWSEQNGIGLSTSYGYACLADCPDESAIGLARMADKRMYEAKAEYYHKFGRDRRRYT